MSEVRARLVIAAAWIILVGGYAVVSLVAASGGVASLAPNSTGLVTFGNVMQCLVPLFANAGLLLNASSPFRRWNRFWMLLALGCTLWLVAQLAWTYFEVYLGEHVPRPFVGDSVIFLHTIPMIAALAMRPHRRGAGEALRYGNLDFLLLTLWWLYLYLFTVTPWHYVVPELGQYGDSYNVLYTAENLVLLIALGVVTVRTRKPWRTVYGHLFAAAYCYTASSLIINVGIDLKQYYTGSLYDVPLVASFVWFGTAGIMAYRLQPTPEPGADDVKTPSVWPRRLAMAGVLSLPFFVAWTVFVSTAPEPVEEFRMVITLVAILLGGSLVFLRQHLVDRERVRLLRASEDAIENLKRLQSQFVQSEKLASLGQLAAGAAHEINNPLTAILGYTELLIDDNTLGPRQRTLVEKLREQARRTTGLVNNLLSFARQVPVEKTLLDINVIVSSALQLRNLDLRDKNIRIELQTESVVPGVRGDPNQLLQVFFNIISNAVDAMTEVGGGVLQVRTYRDRTNVAIEFADTGPGIQQPHLVFDPFYTTKPVGKGTGLGLSICYGIVQEHSGRISCFNRPNGGATFRVELPAVVALFPKNAVLPPTDKTT
jgi:signal transduction histidine kinase